MSVTITPTPGTMPQGYCFTTWQNLLDTISARQTITLDDYYGQFVTSSSTPAPADNDKVWLKLDGGGDPIGWFLYVAGVWTQIDPPNVWVAAGGGTTNVYTMTVANYPSAVGPVANDVFFFSIPAAQSSTGAATLNLNGTGAKSLMVKGSALWSGALAAGNWYSAVYDGTNYEVSGIKQLLVADIPPGTDKQFFRTNATPLPVWESAYYGAGQAIPAAGGSATFSHSLGSTPLFFQVRAKCTTGDLNYAVGDEVDVSSMYNSNGTYERPAFGFMANASSIILVRNADVGAGNIQLPNKTTGSGAVGMTEGSWQLVAYAIR